MLGRSVSERLSDSFCVGLDAVHHSIKGRSDREGRLADGLHGLLDGLLAVRADGRHRLDVLQDAIHHLAAGLGDDPFLLAGAVGEELVRGLGGAGDLAQHFGHGVGVRLDRRRCLLRGGLGLLTGCGRRVAGFGVGRDGDIRHVLGTVGEVGIRADPVVQAGIIAAGGLGQVEACCNSSGHRPGTGQAGNEVLNRGFCQLEQLSGQLPQPLQGAGKATLEGRQQAGAHALDTACDVGEQALADVQPVDGRNDREHSLQNLLPVCQQVGHRLADAHHQLHDHGHTLRQNFRHVVVDDAADIDDDIGHIGDQVRQARDQAVQQLGDEVQAGVHERTGVGTQLLGEGEQLRQSIGQKIRDALRKTLGQRVEQIGAGLQDRRDQRIHQLRDTLQHVADHGQQVALQEGLGRVGQRLQGLCQVGTGGPVRQHILGSGFHGSKAAGQGGGGLLGCGAGDVHLLLDDVDGAVHVGQVTQVVLDAGDLLSILQQALHFSLRAAVAQLQVVQHGVVLLGKALIGVLDILHGAAHFVGVVGHVHHGHVGQLGRGIGVLAHAGKQAGGKAGGLLHVVVGGQAHGLVGLFGVVEHDLLGLHQGRIFILDLVHRLAHRLGVFFDAAAACAEQCFDSADTLLQCTAHVEGIRDELANACRRHDLFDRAHQLGTDALAGLFAQAVGLLAENVGQRSADALRRGHDLHIGFRHFNAFRHCQPPPFRAARAASKSSGLS